MISDNQSICPKCGGQLKYYDHVQRLVRTKFGNKKWVAIRRLRCCKCHAVHRELPDFIFPYKQYEADIIIGVLEGLITAPIYIKKHPKNEFTHSLSALLPNGQDEIVNTEGDPSVSVRFCASR